MIIDNIWLALQELLRQGKTPKFVYVGYDEWKLLCYETSNTVGIEVRASKVTVYGIEVVRVNSKNHLNVTE